MDTLSGEVTLAFYFCLPSQERSTVKGKNLLPLKPYSHYSASQELLILTVSSVVTSDNMVKINELKNTDTCKKKGKIQYNFSGLNTDGLFTTDVSNSFLSS